MTERDVMSVSISGAFGARNKIIHAIEELLASQSASEIQSSEEGESSVPAEFFCPITHQVMTEPVVAAGTSNYGSCNELCIHPLSSSSIK